MYDVGLGWVGTASFGRGLGWVAKVMRWVELGYENYMDPRPCLLLRVQYLLEILVIHNSLQKAYTQCVVRLRDIAETLPSAHNQTTDQTSTNQAITHD